MEEKTAQAPVGAEPSRKRRGGKKLIVAGAVVVVLVCAGAGMWIWHEQPSFCGAICHTPMASYVDTYDQASGQPGVDKYGNEVSDASAMLAVSHKDAGENCLSCHVPTLGEQISEGMSWVAGDYAYPLTERTQSDLTEARGIDQDKFCLTDGCHEVTTREELKELTADKGFNPHETQHGEIACTECHKAHRASVMICAQCHDEAEVPEGWVAYDASLDVIPGGVDVRPTEG